MIGQHHFKAINFWGGQDSFKKTQYRDQLKNQLIFEHKNDVQYFIRIAYTEELSEINIKKILQEHKIIS